tara:strand:+ start:107 stop:214 length:108 start_codon:yes stop_codon:yes gene_type:complete
VGLNHEKDVEEIGLLTTDIEAETDKIQREIRAKML